MRIILQHKAHGCLSWKRDCAARTTQSWERCTCGHLGSRPLASTRWKAAIPREIHRLHVTDRAFSLVPRGDCPTAGDAGLPSGFVPLFVSGQEWRLALAEVSRVHCGTVCFVHGRAMWRGMIRHPLRKIFTELVSDLN